MRRYQMLVVALTLVLLMVTLSGMVSQTHGLPDEVDAEPNQTQGSDGDAQPSPQFSSAPVTDAEQAPSPPDQPARADEADAEPSQSYNASVRIAGSVMKPRESNVEWTGSSTGGCIYASSGNQSAVFNTPVYLPQGATVRYFRMYYNDQNTSSNCSAWFTIYDLYGDIVQEWHISSSDTGRTYVTTSQLDHVIDYDLYSYVVNWRPVELGSDMQVCGFRIYYYAPHMAYLPTVMRNA